MAKFDLETLMNNIETILKNNLNTKITAINTEKADSITLSTVDNSAYFFQSLNESVTNVNPYIFYGISEIDSEGIGPSTAKSIKVGIMLVVVDSATDLNISKRMLRYLRALEEVFLTEWDTLDNSSRAIVNSFAPFQFTDGINSSHNARVAMVSLDINLAS